MLLRDHSDHHKDIVYLESIPGPDAGHSEDVAGQLKSRSVGGGVTGELRAYLGGRALGERSQEDEDHGDHPVADEL